MLNLHTRTNNRLWINTCKKQVKQFHDDENEYSNFNTHMDITPMFARNNKERPCATSV